MKSIQSRIICIISVILITAMVLFTFNSIRSTSSILESDSDAILLSTADYYARVLDESFMSTEQSVDTIYNYAHKRAEFYKDFLNNDYQRDRYTYDVFELAKSIVENTRGAMAVYFRFNPVIFGEGKGFWYNYNPERDVYESRELTNISLYDEDDVEHVGWYYVPIKSGKPTWIDPYHNANLDVNMISYTIPYFSDGKTIGVVGMDINLDLLRDKVSEVTLYDSGKAFLMTNGGDIIYHENYPDGALISEMPQDKQQFYTELFDSERDSVKVFKAGQKNDNKFVLKELKNGMVLVLFAPIDEINAPQTSLFLKQMLFLIAIIAVSLFVCILMVRTITMPLKKMTEVAKQYENGNFENDILVNSDDEVGTLSRTLQSMSVSLKEQINIANSANKAKSVFLANMSHEIRTPINAMLGMNEMISKETKDQRIREYSFNIKTAGKTLLALINSILDFSKIEEGKMEIMNVQYDTVNFVNNIINSVSDRINEKQLTLIKDIDENLPSMLYGDDVRMTQIISNLLTNSVKYTESGSVTLKISDEGREEGKILLYVCVSDTGMGIRPEDIEKVVESFSRIDIEKNRNIEGTGLGMAIVSNLLEMMGSKLDIQSVYGKGTSISFRILQGISDDTPIGNFDDSTKNRMIGGDIYEYPRITGANILVVDDYDMNLKVSKGILGLFGIIPDLAFSGLEAIDKVQRKKYQIILLDHMMPELDGVKTLQKMRAENLIGSDTKVIALTANAVAGAREYYLDSGFDDYLSKPVSTENLEYILREFLPQELFEGENAKESDGRVVMEFEPRENIEGHSKKKSDHVEELKLIGISVSDGMKYSGGKEDLYYELLSDLKDDFEKRTSELRRNVEDRDIEQYRIHIHALKSASKMVGANELHLYAKKLEDAAKDGNIGYIVENNDDFVESYYNLSRKIGSILDK